MNINIITSRNEDWFSRQILQADKTDHYIKCNSQEDILWDLIVVYENLPHPYRMRHKHGGLIFISGEPPMISCYGYRFLNQFNVVLSPHKHILHKNVVHWQQSLPWMIGLDLTTSKYNMDVEDFLHYNPEKYKTMSTLCSFKKLVPGHRKRNKQIRQLIDMFPTIDVFGTNYRFVKDKKEALAAYMFHICIENSQIRDYWTEKISDPILSLTVPIYIGCTNIEDYFDAKSMFICKSFKEIETAIKKIMADPLVVYNEKLPYLLNERKRLIGEYNILPTIRKIYKEDICLDETETQTSFLSQNQFSEYKFLLIYVKIKRFIFNLFQLS